MHYFCAKVHRFSSPLRLFLSPHQHLRLPAPDFLASRVDSLLAVRQVKVESTQQCAKQREKPEKTTSAPTFCGRNVLLFTEKM